MRPRGLALITMAVAFIAANGCGGSSAKQSTLTRAELIAKGNAICGPINAKLFANPYRSPKDIARLAPQFAADEKLATTQLSALKAPASLAHEWQELVAGVGKIAEQTAQLGEDARKNDIQAGFALLTRNSSLHARMQAMAKHTGVEQCALAG